MCTRNRKFQSRFQVIDAFNSLTADTKCKLKVHHIEVRWSYNAFIPAEIEASQRMLKVLRQKTSWSSLVQHRQDTFYCSLHLLGVCQLTRWGPQARLELQRWLTLAVEINVSKSAQKGSARRDLHSGANALNPTICK